MASGLYTHGHREFDYLTYGWLLGRVTNACGDETLILLVHKSLLAGGCGWCRGLVAAGVYTHGHRE